MTLEPATRKGSPDAGFSLVELLLALVVTAAVTGAALLVVAPMHGAMQAQPEGADVEQRVRLLSDTLVRNLSMAGAQPARLPEAATARIVPGVLPHRVGRRNPDPPGSYVDTRITLLWADAGGPQSRLALPLAAASGSTDVQLDGSCPPGDLSCGFRAGMTVLVFDDTASWDLYTVSQVAGARLSLVHDTPDSPKVYGIGAAIAAASVRTYYLADERGSGIPQLLQYDGGGGADVPVLNHVVSLRFVLAGEADAPYLLGTGGLSPHATYGPAPPVWTAQPTAYPPGENCVFQRTASGEVVSRLPALGTPASLVVLDGASLSDGPWCPDATSPGRFDADLLRVRKVVVTARVQAAVASLRGPAGPLFTRAGTARGTRLVPDREVRLAVTPRGAAAGW